MVAVPGTVFVASSDPDEPRKPRSSWGFVGTTGLEPATTTVSWVSMGFHARM